MFEVHIFSWFKQRKELRKAEEIHKGYGWAAGMLLSGHTEKYIEEFTRGSQTPSFDLGVSYAIKDWQDRLTHYEREKFETTYAERQRCANLCLRPAGWLTPDQKKVADEIRDAILAGYGGKHNTG